MPQANTLASTRLVWLPRLTEKVVHDTNFGGYFATAATPKVVSNQLQRVVKVYVPSTLQNVHRDALLALDRRREVRRLYPPCKA